MRDVQGATVTDYRTFLKTSFPEIRATPDYFKKEDVQSQEMNFGQLDHYIRDLQQSGFDTKRLSVALWHKLSYPLITVVMAMLAIPFALSMGRRGSITGVAVAIAVALAYMVVDNLFGAMGYVNYLPASYGRVVRGCAVRAGRRISVAEDADVAEQLPVPGF